VLGSPSQQTHSQIARTKLQRVTDLLKGERPIFLTAQNPSLGVPEQIAASSIGASDIFLKALNGVSQNRKHELLFRKKMIPSLICFGILK
jgi:hypothetical protein